MTEDLEARLRRELSSWAEEAPPPTAVSVRTLDAAYAAPVERSRPAWLLSAIAACVLLQVLLPTAMDAIGASGLPVTMYISVFGVALPLLVYAFLSGGWMLKVAVGLLR